MNNKGRPNTLTINLDVENLTAGENVILTATPTISSLVIKANHCIEKIDIFTLDKKYIRGFDVKSLDFVLNFASLGTDMCKILISFKGIEISHSLLLL
ncbi:MAG: hypothetical protein ACOYM0_16225 [Bacteroidales bacterium]